MLLCAWAAVWVVPHLWRAGVSWHFFDLGSRLILAGGIRGGGLSLYASHPNLQIGPLAFLFAVPLRAADPWHGSVVAIVVMSALGPLLLWLVGSLRIRGAGPVERRSLAFAGLFFLPVWAELAAHFAHLDDALALTFAVLALHAVEKQRPLMSGVLLACAADCKPWAAAFVPLLLVLAPPLRLRAAIVWAAGLAVAWLPFVIATPGSLRAAAFSIPTAASSALRALGVSDPRTPAWDRPVQLGLGCLIAVLCVRAGRWPAVLFAVIAVRLLFDPQTYAYYTSGLVLAAVLVDLFLTRFRFPVYSCSAVIAVYVLRATPLDFAALGQIRAAYCIAALGSLFLPRLARIDRLTLSVVSSPERSDRNAQNVAAYPQRRTG